MVDWAPMMTIDAAYYWAPENASVVGAGSELPDI